LAQVGLKLFTKVPTEGDRFQVSPKQLPEQ